MRRSRILVHVVLASCIERLNQWFLRPANDIIGKELLFGENHHYDSIIQSSFLSGVANGYLLSELLSHTARHTPL